jgi:hypothetical protein
MAMFTLKPGPVTSPPSSLVVDWGDGSFWAQGAVPNGPDAEVAFAPPSLGNTAVNILAGQSFAVKSVSVSASWLSVVGALSVSDFLTVSSGIRVDGILRESGSLSMGGGTVTAGQLVNGGGIAGRGQILVVGDLSNTGGIYGSGLTVTAGRITGAGQLEARGGDLTVKTAGGMAGLSAGTLTGGPYYAGGWDGRALGGTLRLDVGQSIATVAASVTLMAGGQIETYDAGAWRPIGATLRTVAANGALNLEGASFTGTGPLAVAGTLKLTTTTPVVGGATYAAALSVPQLTVGSFGAVSGVGTVTGDIVNRGVITATANAAGDVLKLAGPVTGDGVLKIAAGSSFAVRGPVTTNIATLELGGPASGTVQFENGMGVLKLDAPLSFTGKIDPAGAGDQIVLGGVSASAITGLSYTAGDGGGTLTLTGTGASIALKFVGAYAASAFTYAAGASGLVLTVGAEGGVAPDAILPMVETWYANVTRLPAAGVAGLSGIAAGITSGNSTVAEALAGLVRYAGNTTSVATLAYNFFTGTTPYLAGLDYLVSPTGTNPNNLNSAYYQSFGIENRYINFAVNLGKLGEGHDRFQADYGGLNLGQATMRAYAEIFGAPLDAARMAALLSDLVPNGTGGSFARADYFAFYGRDGADGLGTKAAMVGWLLAQAVKEGVGPHYLANDALLKDLAPDGTAILHTNLLTAYAGAAAGLATDHPLVDTHLM